MTPEEIRALPADNMNATDQALLREIAAQLAEQTQIHREQSARVEELAKRRADADRPTPNAGTIVKLLTIGEDEDAYGEFCGLCGSVHPVTKEEALRLVADFEAKSKARPM